MSEAAQETHQQSEAETRARSFTPDPAWITYDCPKGGLNPFDVEEPATQHLFKAEGALTGGARFSRAWIGSKDPDDTADTADRDADAEAYYGGIPPARATQFLWEKLAVIHQGRLIAAWPETAMPLYRPDCPDPYRVLDSTLNERDQGRGLHHDEPHAPPYGHQSYDQAATAARTLTHEAGEAGWAGWTGETVMVARLLGARSLY